MSPINPSFDEGSRLEALREYRMLDTPPEPELDDLATLAAAICEAPIALITLVDEDRQWFKSRVGTELEETPREISFCAHALGRSGLLIVPDATLDSRFAQNPLVTGEPGIRFYAGAPLVTPKGSTLGTLCVIDHEPRTLTAAQERALEVLSRQVMTFFELHRHERELRESEDLLAKAFWLSPDCVTIVRVSDQVVIRANEAICQMLGRKEEEVIGHRSEEYASWLNEEERVGFIQKLDEHGECLSYEMTLQVVNGAQMRFNVSARLVTMQGEPCILSVMRNVTATRRTESALEASELRYRRLFESAQDGILILDAETGMVVDVNPFLVKLLGFSHEEFMGKAIWDLGFFRDVVANEAKFSELRDKEYVRYDSLPLETSDGRKIEVEFVSNVYLVKGSRVIQCNVRDITKRKRAEAQLKLLETCVARLNDFVVITEAEPQDEPGPRIVFVNDAFVRRTGYTREEALGKSPRFLQGPKTSRSELDRIHAALKAWKPVRAELINYSKSGEEIWIELDIVPVADAAGWITHWVAVERDITERKRAEDRFRRLVDSSAQGVIFWKTNGAINGSNEAFLKLTGYSRDDLDAGRMNWIAMTPPEYAELDRHCLREIAAKGVCAPFEKEYIRKDGSQVPVLIGAASFEDSPEEGVCFVLDLTERKKLEHQYFRAQRMESIGTLAGGIAHDLNNALSPIMMSLDLLKMKFTDDASQNLLSIISTSAARGADMVRQVLSFARGVEGQRIQVQVGCLLKEIEKITNETFLKHIQVRTTLPPDLWTVTGDPTQIHQVLLNFCVNARDAMPTAGLLSLSASNVMLDEQYAISHLEAKPGPYVVIRIEDNGIGMTPEVLDKIFEPFFTTKEVGKGTGLGLSTSLAIVKSHGGFIRAYSEVGVGTKFEIYLPASAEAPAAAPAMPAPEMPRGHGEWILVVDDEAAVRLITQQTLEAFGYHVILAASGAEAVTIFAREQTKIAAVLTDMMMPGIDGPATIQILRKMNPTLPIIAASGLAAHESVTHAASLGVKHFLPKPYTGETLLKTLQKVLSEPT